MRSAAFLLPLLLVACSREPAPAADAPTTATATAAPAPGPAPTAESTTSSAQAVKLGEPITVKETVALADVAKNPAAFKGKTIATTGTVKAVCQERGCWMAIADGSSPTATVRMHGHSFFVPKSSSGKKAKVQGTLVLVKDGMECDDMNAQGAQLEMDATGVELL